MYKLRSPLAIGIAALLLSSAAHAITIDFNDLHNTGELNTYNSITESGYQFTNDCGRYNCFAVLGESFPISSWNMDPSGAAVQSQFTSATTGVHRLDGAAFNLTSIDFADGFNAGLVPMPGNKKVAVGLQFTFGYAAGGFSTVKVNLDDKPGAQTVFFNETGVSSFSIVGTGTDNDTLFSFDNVVVSSVPAVTAAVPEPESWALMLGGMAALGLVARRRAQS